MQSMRTILPTTAFMESYIIGGLFNIQVGYVHQVGMFHLKHEWGTLISNLGGSKVAGGKLKSVSALWNQPNIANNSSGFSALPAGYRIYTGDYLSKGFEAWFWTSTTDGDSCQCQAFCQQLNNTSGSINGAWPYTGRKWGLPVRCVKN